MDVDYIVEISRQAMVVTMLICAPVLIVGVLSGLIIGLMQAVTQIQDQTIAFVPKLLLMMVACGLSLPWALQVLVEFSAQIFGAGPGGNLGGGG
ncbi:MAG: flagellar biosynthetic protein FliQ [Planctomycetales bacterium]|nr:flagellar biosynthetic protein FliQ [Planctomycetales bacterium]